MEVIKFGGNQYRRTYRTNDKVYEIFFHNGRGNTLCLEIDERLHSDVWNRVHFNGGQPMLEFLGNRTMTPKEEMIAWFKQTQKFIPEFTLKNKGMTTTIGTKTRVPWDQLCEGDAVWIAGNLDFEGEPTCVYGCHKVVDPEKQTLVNNRGSYFFERMPYCFIQF